MPASVYIIDYYIDPCLICAHDFHAFVHHGRKLAPVLYIYPSTGTENNTERIFQFCDVSNVTVWKLFTAVHMTS